MGFIITKCFQFHIALLNITYHLITNSISKKPNKIKTINNN
ncbi:hypothetical protein PROVRETT_09015 [Providencia rettgeri DSM 1131]|nr:hypothetical protein PROVRETT_09015 [Providencia rettgeri DSM 1131]